MSPPLAVPSYDGAPATTMLESVTRLSRHQDPNDEMPRQRDDGRHDDVRLARAGQCESVADSHPLSTTHQGLITVAGVRGPSARRRINGWRVRLLSGPVVRGCTGRFCPSRLHGHRYNSRHRRCHQHQNEDLVRRHTSSRRVGCDPRARDASTPVAWLLSDAGWDQRTTGGPRTDGGAVETELELPASPNRTRVGRPVECTRTVVARMAEWG
jgi:hypothetical protein